MIRRDQPNNAQYLCFAHLVSGDGCFGGNNHLVKDLQRLDLTTGEVEDISSGVVIWQSHLMKNIWLQFRTHEKV